LAYDYCDRRKDTRVSAVQAVFIEVVGRGSRESDNPVIRCETVDISIGGLRLLVPEAIAPGSSLNIAVPFGDWQDNLELQGRAVWCRPAEGGAAHWVGLQLEDSPREDMERWCHVVHRLSAAKIGS